MTRFVFLPMTHCLTGPLNDCPNIEGTIVKQSDVSRLVVYWTMEGVQMLDVTVCGANYKFRFSDGETLWDAVYEITGQRFEEVDE